MEFNISGGNKNSIITLSEPLKKDGILTFDVKMVLENEVIPEKFAVSFKLPAVDCYSIWTPKSDYSRHLGPNWLKRIIKSSIASQMPLHCVLSADGRNRMTIAISDAKTPVSVATGVCEEDACLDCVISFFTIKTSPLKEYAATVRIDLRDIPYYDSIYSVVEWWEKSCGYKPAHVPEHAKLPMNSLWYSYHQNLNVDEILEECRLSKAIGMDTVIIDDGWQTDDNNRGYAFCGDWEVAESKIPDMKAFVDELHAIGMKVMVWFSVPYIGLYSKNYPRFKDMTLDDTGNNRNYWSLDPRYKDVREFLVGVYLRAVTEWGIDGLKLDFIDSFELRGRSLEYDEKRDHQSLEEAVDLLMTEVYDDLRAVCPEIMIEFRQTYIGPAIRKFGNMLRVNDCPGDAIVNRQNVINLRLTSGKTAVHSDPLMWHPDEPAEKAALQIVNALYSVPQISVKQAKLSAEHRKMLEFYLRFWRENRHILLDGKILAANPESSYSLVCAEKDGEAVFTSYTDRVIPCANYRRTVAVNASRFGSLILKDADGGEYEVVDCMGEKLANGFVSGNLFEVEVPISGMVTVKNKR